jgi:hypothetical protein
MINQVGQTSRNGHKYEPFNNAPSDLSQSMQGGGA